MAIIRVKEGVQATVWDAGSQQYITLVGGVEFDSSDPLVKTHGWAFETDEQAADRGDRRSRARKTETSLVEDASAVPGQKRNR